LNRYGSLIHQVLALTDGRPDLRLPIAGAPDYLAVEAVYAASHEGALHLEGVLARRMHVSIEYPHRGLDSARPGAGLVAPGPARSRSCWRRCSTGTPRRSSARSRCTPPGWRPSAIRRTSPATTPRTPSARPPRTHAPA